ncbi:MAG: hypothetical protein LBN40_00655 [Oscillospiraceae bacterium]|nr:hypothetical protein [Oscillospiraceae bacterium]
MNSLTKFLAGIKKESAFFTRTFRAVAIFLAVAVMAFLNVFMLKAMPEFSKWYDEQLQEITNESGVDIGISMESTMGGLMQLMSDGASAASNLSSTFQLVLIMLAIFLAPVAGGEQKKRSIVIPYCAGLKPVHYVLPKFVLYPLVAFVLITLGNVIGAVLSGLWFEGGTVTAVAIVESSFFMGLYAMFAVSLQLCTGIASGRPNIAAGITVVGIFLAPGVLTTLHVGDKYNPFALDDFATTAFYGDLFDVYTYANVWSSVVITLGLIAVMYLITLFSQKAQRVENAGSDLTI